MTSKGFFLLSTIFVFALGCDNSIKNNTTAVKMAKIDMNASYSELWLQVKEFDKKKRPRSALKLVYAIKYKAQKEKKPDHIVKCHIYSTKEQLLIGEKKLPDLIREMEKELISSSFIEKAVLQSLLAELYWNYFNINRYRFYKRSKTSGLKEKDVSRWSLHQIMARITELHKGALKNKFRLQNVKINVMDEILVKNSHLRHLRPTLYDFIAHRALAFFMNHRAALRLPRDSFEISGASFFYSTDRFVMQNYSTKDKNSLIYSAVDIFQDLEIFQRKFKNPSGLIDVALKRLEYMRSKSIDENKEALYFDALSGLEKKYSYHSSSALITFHIAKWYKRMGLRWKKGSPSPHLWSIKRSRDICLNVIRRSPKTDGAASCKALIIKKKYLALKIERTILPQRHFLSLVKYKNIDQIYFRIVPVTTGITRATKKYMSTKKLINLLVNKKYYKQWKQNLKDNGDMRSHSVEVKMPPLKKGSYYIISSTSSDFSYNGHAVTVMKTTASNLSFTHVSDGNKINLRVFDRKSGFSLSGVNALVQMKSYNYKKSKYEIITLLRTRSDSQGSFSFVKRYRLYRSFIVTLKKGDDTFVSSFSAYSYRVKKKNINKVFLFTDRAIYRPGQKIYFKGIYLKKRKNYRAEVLPNENVTVNLYDRNNQKHGTVNVRSNVFGSFSGSFTAPSGTVTGLLSIRTPYGRKTISMEEYKRPKFETRFKKLKGEYRLNEKITTMGMASSYSGAPLTGASVKYLIERRTNFWYGRYNWYYYHFNNTKKIIAKGQLKTNDKGEYSISFKALPDKRIPKKEKPVFTYKVKAVVTDINGETHSTVTYINAGYVALKITPYVASHVDNNKALTLLLSTTNLNGVFQKAIGRIEILKMKESKNPLKKRIWRKPDRAVMTRYNFKRYFPNSIYMDEEEKNKKQIESRVYQGYFNTGRSKKIVLRNIKSWRDGRYMVRLTTRDAYGNKITAKRFFKVNQITNERNTMNSYFYVAIPQTTVEPGKTAKILLGSATRAQVVLDIISKDSSVKQRVITLNNNKKIISIPVTEKDRGNIAYRYFASINNRTYSGYGTIHVPWTNRRLNLKFKTFRNKLKPGDREQWKIKVSGYKGDKSAAEVLAAMYDSSLDTFKSNSWNLNGHSYFYNYNRWMTNASYGTSSSRMYNKNWNKYASVPRRFYERMNLFGLRYYYYRHLYKGKYNRRTAGASGMLYNAPRKKSLAKEDRKDSSGKRDSFSETKLERDQEKKSTGKVQIRKNLNETAFFYPHLKTNRNGEVIFSFNAPESLTKWKFMALGHTKNLSTGSIVAYTVTQKEIMVMPNVPRFLREGDTVIFSTKISNVTSRKLRGTAYLKLFDAVNSRNLSGKLILGSRVKRFSVKKKGNTLVTWTVKVPENIQALRWQVVAKSSRHSDGEESTLPVLSNRMLVTESLPLTLNTKGTKTFLFKKLLQSGNSKTMTNHRLTLEFTSNPLWYAVQSLPYLMEYPHECSEQVFSRVYANALATHIVNSSPRIKKVFNQWKNTKALLSNLQKNKELKSIILEETPWVLHALNEEQQKKRVALLFDMNRMSGELNKALKKLNDMQGANGGWPWFKGLPESRYITQLIAAGLAKLNRIGVKIPQNKLMNHMTKKAIPFLDALMHRDYEYLKSLKVDMNKNHIGYINYHYLYVRSFYRDMKVSRKYKKAFNYWLSQTQKYWSTRGTYVMAMAAVSLHRFDRRAAVKDIMVSLRETATVNEELGMFWQNNQGGYFWYQAPIETQALVIEAFHEIESDKKAVNQMITWLIKMKQVQNWRTTKATVDASYAMLIRGGSWLKNSTLATVRLGTLKVDPYKMGAKVEAGTGYYKVNWKKFTPSMGKVIVKNPNDNPVYGSLYWQYFEDIDKITSHKTQLSLTKMLFKEFQTSRGKIIKPVTDNLKIKPGDKLIVRILLTVDRTMDYVHMKDMRAAGTEPIETISRHKYQDGLYYYQSTRDTATHFFFERLRKGRYVFEYPLRVNLKGNYSAGITTIQCMYAPEFTSHSQGSRLKIQ